MTERDGNHYLQLSPIEISCFPLFGACLIARETQHGIPEGYCDAYVGSSCGGKLIQSTRIHHLVIISWEFLEYEGTRRVVEIFDRWMLCLLEDCLQ